MGQFLGGKRRLLPTELYSAVIDSWERSLQISGDRQNGSYELSGVRGCVIMSSSVSHAGFFNLKVLRLADEKVVRLSIHGGEDGKIGAPELIASGVLSPSGKYPTEPLEGVKRFLIDIALHFEIILERDIQEGLGLNDVSSLIF
ncbi:MAG: hypothetical protein COU51_03675 [Parcubacteria group bacterium CG10_big_fil_rev_8_21_14_0_10_36_14]|nr:MAG: hypothetical protein COU51_03675 [Parcubacteria group bacterium CG10_big_fil_rev_8_21_14_0_10_36_14]